MHKFLFSILLLLAHTAWAQTRQTDPLTGKMGFSDPNGQLLIPMEYDFLPLQFEPRMVARKGEFYGGIDAAGQVILPFEYQKIEFQPGGQALVSKDRSMFPVWGLADSTGRLILPLAYEYLAVVDTHLLAARTFHAKELHIFDGHGQLRFKAEGREAMPGFDDQSLLLQKANRSSYWVDLQGNTITPPLFENTKWSDGDYFIQFRDNRFGVVNARGETVLPFQYFGIEPQHPGHFSVTDSTYRNFLLNAQEKTLMEGEVVRWSKAPGGAYSKRWSVEYSSNVYDASGKLLVDNCSVYPVISEPGWDKLPDNFHERYSWVQYKKNGLTALYDAEGRQLLPPVFKRIKYCTDRHPLLGFILDEKNKTYSGTAYDFNGKPLMEQQFFSLYFTEDPRILYGQKTPDGLWGFIDLRAPEKADFVYTRLEKQTNGGFIGLKMAQQVNLSSVGQVLPAGIAATPQAAQPGLEVAPLEAAPNASGDETYGMKDVEKQPSFPGGEGELFKFIAKNINYPPTARKNGIQGVVVVSFIIEKDGRIAAPTILRDVGGGCGQEALRLVSTMPNWEPGIKNGMPVRVEYILPVRFRLE